ncbi:MAG: hypothetical protein ACRCV5_07710, partial [Afipia sp.]
MAMIGSPASRGAIASAACARRVCFAASAVVLVSAAMAANITMAEGTRRRIAMVDVDRVNRFTIPFPKWPLL